MITCYAVTYRPPTENSGARFLVKQIESGRSKSVSYDYGHNSPPRKAIHDTFGDDVARIEYSGLIKAGTQLFVSHY